MTTRQDATAKSDTTVTVIRTFDAPREHVWRAWTEPELWAQWFAPDPMTVPRAEIDLRTGGRFTLVMRDEEGNDFTSVGVYREIVAPERLVYADSNEALPPDFMGMLNELAGRPKDTPVPDGVATITLEDIGGKTKLTFSEEFDSKATRDAWAEMQMVEGLDGGFDKLEQLLARSPSMAR